MLVSSRMLHTVSARWRFALVTGAALAGVLATASLGFWHLDRAAQKEALQAAMDAREQQAPVDGAAAIAALAPSERLHRAVHLQGRWQAEHTVYLDNRQMQGRPGFYVLTPLRLDPGPGVVLVQRGWAPRHQVDRSLLPPVQTPTGAVQVSGRIAAHPPRVYQLGQEQGGAIRQNLDLDAWRAETGLPLAPVLVVQTGAASDSVQRDWPEAASGVEKHYGYAFQWFGLCTLIGLLLLWFQVVRPLYRARRA